MWPVDAGIPFFDAGTIEILIHEIIAHQVTRFKLTIDEQHPQVFNNHIPMIVAKQIP